MMNSCNEIYIETQTPFIEKSTMEEYIKNYGEKELKTAHFFSSIVGELSRESNPAPHVLFQIIQNFFQAVNSKDPLSFHQDVARLALQDLLEKETAQTERNYCVDLLARELCDTLNKIGDKIFKIPTIVEKKQALNKIALENGCNESVFEVLEFPKSKESDKIDKLCFIKGIFTPVYVLTKELEALSKGSKKFAQEIRKKVKPRTKFWFSVPPKEGKLFFHSPAFIGLTKRLWKDKISKRVAFDNKFPPCVIKPIHNTLISLTRAKPDKGTEKINLVENNEIIGQINIPTIPAIILNRIFSGLEKLNSVVGHKSLRYCVNLPYEQKIKGIQDYRAKEFDGGFSELGSNIGITNKKDLKKLKEILYALKYLDITNIQDDKIIKGRLVDVSQYQSPKTGREDGLSLTVLPTLVGVGEIDCSGKLLIPMSIIAPPTQGIAPNQFHANLYLLQMVLLEKFSNNSKELFQYNCIKITRHECRDLLNKAGVPISYESRIIDGWSQDRKDAPRVIKRISEDHYSLGEAYTKATKFLTQQGKFRLQQSERGKLSAQKKKNKQRDRYTAYAR